jgi:hypothetical protein
MTPKEGYASFDLASYIDRYFVGVTFDVIQVRASYISDEESALWLTTEEWPDAIEIMTYTPEGTPVAYYVPRGPERMISYSESSARVDPIRTTPRRVFNLNPTDVDLNGVVDGQDALDVLFHRGKDSLDFNRTFPRWADVDRDERISDADLTEVVRLIGSYPQ